MMGICSGSLASGSISSVCIFQFGRYFSGKKRWWRRVNLWTNFWRYRQVTHENIEHVFGFTCFIHKFTLTFDTVVLWFSDESFAVSHTKRGILGMANKGPHSNGSQFYITLQPTLWMDRTYVAFGFVSANLRDNSLIQLFLFQILLADLISPNLFFPL